jgi:hypothetical protein
MAVRDEYSIELRNASEKAAAFCVAPAAPHALAWRTGQVPAGGRVECSWAAEYAFFYSVTGKLRPGSAVAPRGIVPVPASGARMRFGWSGGAFSLRPAGDASPGVLAIEQETSIPPEVASIGVAIDGLPAVAVQAQPAIETQFVIHPVYWLGLSRTPIEPGVVADESAFFAVARIEFGGTSRRVVVTMSAEGRLVVRA